MKKKIIMRSDEKKKKKYRKFYRKINEQRLKKELPIPKKSADLVMRKRGVANTLGIRIVRLAISISVRSDLVGF